MAEELEDPERDSRERTVVREEPVPGKDLAYRTTTSEVPNFFTPSSVL